MDQCVQVDAIGLRGAHTAQHPPPVHGEHRLEDRIGAEQQREDRRNRGIANQHQDAQLGQNETEEIGATITEKDEPGWEIPDEEPKDRAGRNERGVGDECVMRLEPNVGDAEHHHHHAHRGQAVEAVDDVDGVGNARNAEQSQRHGKWRHGDERVNARDVGAVDHGAEQPNRKCCRDARGQQSPPCSHLLRQIFRDADEKCGQATRQQEPEACPGAGSCEPGEGTRNAQGHEDADASDPRHGLRVKLLRARQIMVCGELRVERGGANHKERR